MDAQPVACPECERLRRELATALATLSAYQTVLYQQSQAAERLRHEEALAAERAALSHLAG